MNSKIYKQADSRWGSLPYPTKKSSFSGNGCGCCACLHDLIELDEYKDWTPKDLRPYMVGQGFAIAGKGTTWNGITKTLQHYGFKVINHPTLQNIFATLDDRKKKGLPCIGVILFSSGSRGGITWTAGGHYVAYTDYRVRNGKHEFYCKDSGGRNHDGWFCYETQMKGLIPQIWSALSTAKAATVPVLQAAVEALNKLTVDGVGGEKTVIATQRFFKTFEDGIISGQNKSLQKYYPALTSVMFASNGKSTVVKELQSWLGVTRDGVIGQETTKAWQKKLRDLGYLAKTETIDGIFGPKSMKAWQKFLNDQLFPEEKKTTTPTTTTTTKAEPKHKGEVIDISYVQKNIDFAKVKADGVVGAIIRCGFRGYETARLQEDAQFLNHIKGAHKAGLKVGVYFFTEGINAKEGKEEAEYTLNLIKKAGIKLDYPVAIDTEHITKKKGEKEPRANNLSKSKRTEVIKAFCEEIKAHGYEPMIYASLLWFRDNLDMSKLPYKIWCAQYYKECQYKGEYIFWQYTSEGKVSGISSVVDLNKCYIKEAETKNVATPAVVESTPVTADVSNVLATPVVEAIADGMGEGQAYTGTYPTADEIKKASFAGMLKDMQAYARKIADEKYHYVVFKSGDPKTKTCPICNGRKFDDHFGWNCIGYAFSVWHHGGGLKSKCNCHVISNEVAEQILAAKTDAEALKIARNHIGINDIELIRNKKGIPKSQWKAGDIMMQWRNGKYGHTFFYMGDGKVADSTQSGGVGAKNNIAIRKYNSYTACLIVRLAGGRTYLKKGDEGAAVKKLQNYVDWFFDGEFFKKCGPADGIFGSNTDEWVKKMQTVFFGAKEADGSVGPKTIEKMKAYRKGTATTATPSVDPAPAPVAEKKGYPGTMPTLKLVKTNAQVIADAIKWAKWIVGDNRFHYGHGQHAHHNGCYFCGTQRMKQNHGILDPDFTYCCNPFVGAAWAHGGCVPKALELCRKTSSWDFGKGKGYDKSSLFTNLGHPKKSSLKAGDVLCSDTHVALYIGGGKIAEAGGGDDNVRNSKKWKNSIRISDLTDSRYAKFKRVHRFNGSVNTSANIYHGEVSDRVEHLQEYLDWYTDGEFCKKCGAPDGIFGDNTLKYLKAFQTAQKITADGIVGPNTIAKMGKVVK